MTAIDSRRRAWAGRLFVAPNLIAVAVFMLFPLGFSLFMSLQDWDLFSVPRFVGLANFRHLFTADPLFLIAVRNTVIFTIGTIVPTVLISLAVAGILFCLGLVGLMVRRNILFVLMSLEVMMNAAALAFIVAGARWVQPDGQVMFILVISLAAAEASIGLAILLQLYRRFHTLDIDAASEMRG